MNNCWKRALLHAVPISLFVLGLFFYWFSVADRYAVFLYGHLDATPFDELTSSRYWMAGLVASGAVMVLYTLVNWAVGRLTALRGRSHRPVAWWRVWALCAAPLAAGIPVITMTVNQPTLPASLAAACALATLAGLALALAPGAWAARRPVELAWLAMDGVGLMPVLLLVHLVESPGRNPSIPAVTANLAAAGALVVSATWLVIMTFLRAWRHRPSPGAGAILVAGLCLSYLLLPLLHHLLLTPPGYRYITASSNFLALGVGVQLLVLSLAAILALGATRLRQASANPGNKEAINA